LRLRIDAFEKEKDDEKIWLVIYCEMSLEFICCMLHPNDMLDYGVQYQGAIGGFLPMESSIINVNIVCEGTD
jgi:hypothetical protein